MQKKGYKVETALVDDIKQVIKDSTDSSKRLSFFEKELVNIQKTFNTVYEIVYSAQDEHLDGYNKLQLFEQSMKELGVDPKSNSLYVEASKILDIQMQYATRVGKLLKSIK